MSILGVIVVAHILGQKITVATALAKQLHALLEALSKLDLDL